MTDLPFYTVEDASRWLTCDQPVPLRLLQSLGKDCSMLCKIRNIEWRIVPTPGKAWPSERAYRQDVIREVFMAHPNTKDYVPK